MRIVQRVAGATAAVEVEVAITYPDPTDEMPLDDPCTCSCGGW